MAAVLSGQMVHTQTCLLAINICRYVIVCGMTICGAYVACIAVSLQEINLASCDKNQQLAQYNFRLVNSTAAVTAGSANSSAGRSPPSPTVSPEANSSSVPAGPLTSLPIFFAAPSTAPSQSADAIGPQAAPPDSTPTKGLSPDASPIGGNATVSPHMNKPAVLSTSIQSLPVSFNANSNSSESVSTVG